MSIYFMFDNHTFHRLDGTVDQMMAEIEECVVEDCGYGFVGCKPPHGKNHVQWSPGKEWTPAVRKMLEEAYIDQGLAAVASYG